MKRQLIYTTAFMGSLVYFTNAAEHPKEDTKSISYGRRVLTNSQATMDDDLTSKDKPVPPPSVPKLKSSAPVNIPEPKVPSPKNARQRYRYESGVHEVVTPTSPKGGIPQQNSVPEPSSLSTEPFPK